MNSGVHTVPNRKSVIGTSRRKAPVSHSSTRMMPAVMRIDPAAHRNSSRSMTNSTTRLDDAAMRINGLSLDQALFQGHLTVAVCAREHRPRLAPGVALLHEIHLALRQRNVADLARQRRSLIEVEVHELLHLGAVERLHLRIDEDRTRQRTVGAVAHGLG